MRYLSSKNILKKYSQDRSTCVVKPTLVAFPKTEMDVVAIVAYARQHNLAITPRGGGTGMSGAAVGKGMIVDFSKYFTKVHSIGSITRVQSGILLKKLRRRVEKKGYMLPGSPLYEESAIGGNVNTRSIGPGSGKYGSMDAQVFSLRGVLADGRIIDTSKKIPQDIHEQLLALQKQLKKDKPLVKLLQKRAKVAGGLNLKALLQYRNINDIITHLIVGSTGTLVLLTELVLRLPTYKELKDLYLIHFKDFDSLQKSINRLIPLGAVSVQYAGRETLELWDKQYRHKDSVGSIIVGFEKHVRIDNVVTNALQIMNIPKKKRAHLWKSRAQALPKLEKQAKKLHVQLPSGIEDTSFNPQYFSKVMKDVQAYAKRKGIKIASFGHLAVGSLHLRPFLDMKKNPNLLDIVSKDIFTIVRKYGGTLIGEHNAGLDKSKFLAMESKKMYAFMKKIKKVFDPDNILNPEVYP